MIIKLCYEELEKYDLRTVKSTKYPEGKLALYQGVPNYKTGIPSTKYISLKVYLQESKCEWCGEEVLKIDTQKRCVCSEECKKEISEWNKEIYRRKKTLKTSIRAKVTKKCVTKTKTVNRDKTIRYLELRDKGQIYPLYERNKILAPYYEIRQSTEDNDYLEVQCTYCKKWYKPSLSQVKGVRSFVQGYNNKKIRSNFYCCSEHQVLLYKSLRKLKISWSKKHIPIEQFILEEREAIHKKETYIENRRRKEQTDRKKEALRLKRVKIRKERSIAKKEFQRLEKERKLLEHQANYKTPTDYSRDQKNRLEKLRKEDPKEFKLRRLFAYSKARAKEKGMQHSITREWLNEKTNSNICSGTGITFDYDTTIQRNPFGPSIDRIDVNKGYTPDNCRLVIWAFNAGLGHYTEKELYIICKAYLLNHGIKQTS